MKFSEFVETYQDDIKAFFEALINFVKALFGKLSSSDDTDATE